MATSIPPQEFTVHSLQLTVQIDLRGFCDVVIADLNSDNLVEKQGLSPFAYNQLLDFLNVHDHPHVLHMVTMQHFQQ